MKASIELIRMSLNNNVQVEDSQTENTYSLIYYSRVYLQDVIKLLKMHHILDWIIDIWYYIGAVGALQNYILLATS